MTHHLPALAARAAQASANVRSLRAHQRATELAPVIAALRTAGATSLRTLAAELNRAGITPPRGATWSPMAVSRTLARIKTV